MIRDDRPYQCDAGRGADRLDRDAMPLPHGVPADRHCDSDGIRGNDHGLNAKASRIRNLEFGI